MKLNKRVIDLRESMSLSNIRLIRFFQRANKRNVKEAIFRIIMSEICLELLKIILINLK